MSKRSLLVSRPVAAIICLAVSAPAASAQSARPLTVTRQQDALAQKAIDRLKTGASIAPRGFHRRPLVQPMGNTPDNWLGGAGNWSTVSLWSTGALPTSTNDVSINDSTPAAVVSLNVNSTIGNLTIGSITGSTSRLSFNSGASLTIDGTTITNMNNTGPLGGITLNSSSLIIAGPVTLTGGGIVDLNGGTSNSIYGATGSDVLTNVNNTIQGSGNIGNGSMGLVNQGTIDANLTTAPLKIQTSSGVTNTGTLEATNGAELFLVTDTYNNTNGTILSSGANSNVVLQAATIDGGTLSTNNGGVFYVSGGSHPTLNGVTIDGTFQLPNTSSTTIEGTITLTSNGSFQMLGCCQNADLIVGGASVTLAGAGSLTMSNTGGAYIYGAAGTDVLTNASTIQGFGTIGYNPATSTAAMGLVNQGTIDANMSTAPLKIQTSSGVTNTGTLEATNGADLYLVADTYNNTNGTILSSGTNSNVVLQAVTINGGTLSTNSGGVIYVSGGSDPTLNGVTINGTFQLPNTSSTTIAGVITLANNGSLQMLGCCQNADLIVGGANVTLTGPGSLTMSNTGGSFIYGAAGTDVLTNASTIQGFGNVGFNASTASMGLINHGTIDANYVSSSYADPLTVWTSNGTTNTGTLEATGGGYLILKNDTFSNASGTILASGNNGSGTNSLVELLNATVVGGTLSTSGGGVIEASGNPTLNGVTNSGLYEVLNGDNTTIAGAITNTGTIQLNAGTYDTYLTVSGNATLNGNGTIVLANDSNNVVEGATGTEVLTNNGNTIEGSGNLGNAKLGLINGPTGTILADQSTELYIKPGSAGFTNNGTVQANTGSTLDITGGIFTNFNSGTNTLTGGTYNANGGTIQFDNANIVTNAADIVLSGSGSQIVSNTNANALANFATNAAGGVFQLGAGRSFTTSAPGGGNFSNEGTLIVGAGDTFKVAGALSNFSGTTLTGGAYYVAGTLQFGPNGSSLLTNDANLTLAGASPQLIDLGGNNLLTGFNTNGAAGTFTVAAGGSYTTPGSFSNSGIMDLEQASSLTVAGNLTNSGTVATNSQNLQGGANTLAVTGTLTNNSGANLTIGANSDTSDVANVALLSNSGTVTVDGGATLNLTSAGADASSNRIYVYGGTLDMQAGSFTNSGTIDVAEKGTLTVNGNLTNSSLLGTNLYYEGGGPNAITISGTLANTSTGTLNLGLGGQTADVASVGLLSNAGYVKVWTGATLDLTGNGAHSNSNQVNVFGGTLDMQAGSFTNSGSLDVEAAGMLAIHGNLSNTGTIVTNSLDMGGANTIAVTGTLTNNNGASVTIGNNDTGDQANVGVLANSGAVNVASGATLILSAAATDTNSGGITVDAGTLDVQAGSLTNSGTLDLEQKATLIASGNLTNSGTLTTNHSNLGGGANTISIAGTLTNTTVGSITIGANNDTTDTASAGLLSNAGTIAVDQGASLKLTAAGADANTGSIALSGGTMSVASGGAFTNSGSLDEENGGKLTVTGGMTNAGTLSTNDANLGGSANSIAVSGKLTNNSGATVALGAHNDTSDTASFGTLANSGTVTVGTGATLTLSGAGANTNPGTLQVSGVIDSKGSLTLSGTGTLTLTGGAVTATGAGDSLKTGTKNTIQGSGTISGFAVTNAGTLSANQSAPLIFLPGAAGLDNTGTMQVSAGDTMVIGTSAGGALTNFSGATLTGGTYNLSGVLQFGASGTTIATNAANITLNGAGEMLDFGSHNILAGFNDNAVTGVFKLASGASLTTTGGSFTNAGAFTVSAGTTFTVGGSGTNFTQTAGSSTIDGTLTSTSLGTISVNSGSLSGEGTLGDNVIDAGALSPGDSAAKTGKLTVADNYTQDSTGTLNIQIDGATASKYDQLKVTDVATLGGTLDITVKAGVTLTAGQKFTILTAASVSGAFAAVNGIVINGNQYFTVTYNAGSVVLTVTNGTPPAGGGPAVTQLFHPALDRPRLAQVPAALTERVPAPVQLATGAGLRGFRPRDDFGPAAGPVSTNDGAGTGSLGIAPVSAAAYNSMAAMNHMRFECGVDLKALLHTGRKKLVRALWAAPDSPDALAIGYMAYTASH